MSSQQVAEKTLFISLLSQMVTEAHLGEGTEWGPFSTTHPTKAGVPGHCSVPGANPGAGETLVKETAPQPMGLSG